VDANRADRYENFRWYPGIREVNRLKQKWFEDHPQIRQVSNPSGSQVLDGTDEEKEFGID